jgi:uncharacterized protein (DUF169 family)
MMRPLTTDFSILNELGFDRQPVGVKFEYFKPESIKRLDTPLALCEMIREAQRRSEAFYMDRENEDCMGKGALGMMDGDPTWAGAGLIGERMHVFSDGIANRKCMTHYTTMNPGGTNYVVFAPLSDLSFEPDLLVCTGDARRIGTLLRAMSYSTGEMFESKSTPVFQCSWMFSYPAMTGKVNYVTMGMGHGTTARHCYEPGEMLISIPSNWFSTIMANLHEMPLVPDAWEMTRDEWLEEEKGIYAKIIEDAEKAGWA